MIPMITQYPNWLRVAEHCYWNNPSAQHGWPMTRQKNLQLLEEIAETSPRQAQVDEAECIIQRRGWDSIDVEREKKAAAMQKTIDEMKLAESEAAHAAKNYKMNWQSHGS